MWFFVIFVPMSEEKNINCSFCGRDKQDTNVLIAGINSHICDSCIEQAVGIVHSEKEGKDQQILAAQMNLLKPIDIKAHLDQYVIGQDNAKKILSVAVYNHYKRLVQPPSVDEEEIEIEKSNIIMVGQTGTGKTLLARTIAKVLNVPFCIADATVLTEAGYVGEDVEAILSRLLQAADYDVKAAQRGIVFIDEVDKIARKSDNPSITRDVSGEGVQQAMLKLLEGAVVQVPPQGGRKHPEQKMVSIDTKNILFVCGGAFDGIDRVIGKRLSTQAIGYNSNKKEKVDKDNLLQYISPQDLKGFGLIPELIGRLPVLTHLKPLDKEALRQILTEPKNSLTKQYVKLFEMDGITLSIDDEVLDYIVEKAIDFKLGARGLRSICETIMIDAMFDGPSDSENNKEFKLTLEYAQNKIENSTLQKLKVA
jgi:ATP-dependent Clp protease ATP-binding subunit ClpX|tara:strand:+ start:3647 stop:4915 length:1269 start_codon:yes stop_codon:yes gene_type:complete